MAPGNSWRFGRLILGELVLQGYSAAGAVLDVSASEFIKSGEIPPKKGYGNEESNVNLLEK